MPNYRVSFMRKLRFIFFGLVGLVFMVAPATAAVCGGEGQRLCNIGDVDGNTYDIKIPAESSVSVETRVEPIAPCQCGTHCPPKVGSVLQANDNKLAGTEFLWVGMAGVGAVAFTRRRRNKTDKEL